MSQPPELKGGLGFSFSVGAPPQIQTPPLRLVVMGDFSGAGSVSLGPVEATTDELDQLWVRLSRELVLEVPDHLSGGNKTLFVKIPVANLSDFTPAAVLERLPQLAPVKELALALEQHKASADPAPVERAAQGCFGVPALATLLDRVMRELGAAGPAATPAPAAPAPAKQAEKDEGDGALDRILGMVDMGSSSPPEAQNTAAKSAVAKSAAAR